MDSIMQGYEIKFNVYADSQEEADSATLAVKSLISEYASRGVAVTGSKISEAVEKWKGNIFVFNYFK